MFHHGQTPSGQWLFHICSPPIPFFASPSGMTPPHSLLSFHSLFFLFLFLFRFDRTLQIAYRPRVGSSLPRLIATLDPVVQSRFQTPRWFLSASPRDIENWDGINSSGLFFSSLPFWMFRMIWTILKLWYGFRYREALRIINPFI